MGIIGSVILALGVGLIFGGVFLTVSVGQMSDKDRENIGHGPKGQGK